VTIFQDHPTTSLSARVGAVALALSAPANLGLQLLGPRLGPLNYIAWLGVSLGVLCFCEEMGAGRPLNRAGLVLFAAAFCAATMALLGTDPGLIARAHLLYAFALLGALVLWSAALMHRRTAARSVGAVGAAVGGGALVLLVAAHLLLGTATVVGFSQLFAALDETGRSPGDGLTTIDSILCVWSLAISTLLWNVPLRA
jgi:hypothetical protein